MARVIEPIGLLALLLRRTTAITTSTTAISNIYTIGTRWYSSSMKNRFLMPETNSHVNYSSPQQMLCFARSKSTSSSIPTALMDVNNNALDKKAKQKKAATIKKLHKANKEMFGELLETQQEKVKRVRKESKKSKIERLQLEASQNADSSLQLESGSSTTKKPVKKTSKTKIPKSLPMTENTVQLQTEEVESSSSPEDVKAARMQSKKAELNWTLKSNPKMTKIIGTSYNQRQASLAIDDKRDEIFRSPSESQEEESRGVSSSSGQSSVPKAAGEATTIPSMEQFLTSIYECHDMQPSSELKVIKKPGLIEHNPINISIESIDQLLEAEASSSGLSEDVREFDQSHNTGRVKPLATRKTNVIKFSTKRNDADENKLLNSKLSPNSSPSSTKGPVLRRMTNKDETLNQEVFLQENEKIGNVKSSTKTDNNNTNVVNSKADTSASNNVHNQKASPILITVPYFNPERAKLPVEVEGFNPNLNSHEDDDNNNEQKNQIISIPFPRTFYQNNNQSSQPEQPERKKDDNNNKGLNFKLPSVSKILNETMPKEQAEALLRWQAKMISQMGEEGFFKYKENMLNNGKMLHSNIETYLRGTPLDEISVAETISGHWNSLKNIIGGVQGVQVLESRVVHPKLMYCGIVDCVAVFRNKLVVIDWKTSQKLKPFVSMTYDTPIQIAAYIGAINYDPNYSLKIDEGLIVIAYEDGTIGQTFSLRSLDVSKYWQKWLERLNIFNQMNQKSSQQV